MGAPSCIYCTSKSPCHNSPHSYGYAKLRRCHQTCRPPSPPRICPEPENPLGSLNDGTSENHRNPRINLAGGWPTPLKNMTSSVGMMTFPIWWESHKIPWFQSPPIRNVQEICCFFAWKIIELPDHWWISKRHWRWRFSHGKKKVISSAKMRIFSHGINRWSMNLWLGWNDPILMGVYRDYI